jgi:hypothetical protein
MSRRMSRSVTLHLTKQCETCGHVEEINFYVLCNDELTYSEYIEKRFQVISSGKNNKHQNVSCVIM